MALQGTIDSFPVMDVLGLLAASSKTGVLELNGDRGEGRLWLREGSIIAGDVKDHPTATAPDVVFEFLRFETAAFEFTGDDVPPTEEFDAPVGETIEAAQEMLGQWQEVCEVVPDTRCRVTLVAELEAPEVTLSAPEWALIAASASGPSVAEVLERLGLGEFEGCSRLAELAGRGILETVESASDAPEAPGNAIKPDVVSAEEFEVGSDHTRFDGAGTTFGDAPFESTAGGRTTFGVTGDGFGVTGDEEHPGLFPGVSDPLGLEADAGYFDDDPTPDEGVSADGFTVSTQAASPVTEGDQAGVFPDHFPIDDLVGTEGSVSFDTPPGVTTHAPSSAAFSSEPTPHQADNHGSAADGIPVAGDTGMHEDSGHAQAFDTPEPWDGTQGQNGPEPGDDVLAQIGRLSPKAAEAIAAALGDGEHG